MESEAPPEPVELLVVFGGPWLVAFGWLFIARMLEPLSLSHQMLGALRVCDRECCSFLALVSPLVAFVLPMLGLLLWQLNDGAN